MKNILFILLCLTAIVGCKKDSNNDWKTRIDNKVWLSYSIGPDNWPYGEVIGFEVKLGCGGFKLKKRYLTDLVSDTILCYNDLTHSEFVKGNYSINNNILTLDGEYYEQDYKTIAGTCFHNGKYHQEIKLDDNYKSKTLIIKLMQGNKVYYKKIIAY